MPPLITKKLCFGGLNRGAPRPRIWSVSPKVGCDTNGVSFEGVNMHLSLEFKVLTLCFFEYLYKD